MASDERPGPLTEDRLLGGRVKIRQPKQGFRVSIDTVLLSAAVPCGDGDRVLEPGAGVGGAALTLVARVPGCSDRHERDEQDERRAEGSPPGHQDHDCRGEPCHEQRRPPRPAEHRAAHRPRDEARRHEWQRG